MNKLFNDPFKDKIDVFEKTVAVVMALWVLYALFAIAFFGGIICVAWHFISKYW